MPLVPLISDIGCQLITTGNNEPGEPGRPPNPANIHASGQIIENLNCVLTARIFVLDDGRRFGSVLLTNTPRPTTPG